jgi:heme A synthase
MKMLRRLALAAVAVALGTVMLGSWTRINGAGMTCPDWPLCHGRLIPSLTDGTVWEWTHRLIAFLVAPLVLAVIVEAWRRRGRSTFILPTVAAIAILFVVQVLLGAATVHLSNSPVSVVLHWGVAMAFIAALAAMAIFAAAADSDDAFPAGRFAGENVLTGILAGTALVAFVTMCIGAFVSSSGAGLACLSIPGCAGNVVVYTQGQYVQMLHRILAGGTLLCAAASLALTWVRPTSVRVRVAVCAGVALVCVQVLLGLMNVVLRLPMDLREAHAFNAALVFLTFVIAAIFAALESRVRKAALS